MLHLLINYVLCRTLKQIRNPWDERKPRIGLGRREVLYKVGGTETLHTVLISTKCSFFKISCGI